MVFPSSDLTGLQVENPTYIVGLSLAGAPLNPVGSDGAGNLRAIDYATSATGSAIPISASMIGGSDGTLLRALKVDSSGRVAINLNDSNGLAITIGQKTMSSGVPVTLASDQSVIPVTDSINVAVSTGSISVSTTSIEAKVGASRLIGRRALLILPTNGNVYWGSTSSVTISTGIPIFKNQSYPLNVTDNIPIWLIASATTDVRIVEGS